MPVVDEIDRKIVGVLAVDGRLPATKLSRQVGLSTSATNERLRCLADLEQIVDARHVTGPSDYQLQATATATDVEDLDRLLERPREEAGADETMTRLALRTVPGSSRQPAL